MKPTPVESIQEEEGILYNIIQVDVNSNELYEALDFIKPGYCKVIMRIDKNIMRTHYFKNGAETSKEKILQDERIKQLRR